MGRLERLEVGGQVGVECRHADSQARTRLRTSISIPAACLDSPVPTSHFFCFSCGHAHTSGTSPDTRTHTHTHTHTRPSPHTLPHRPRPHSHAGPHPAGCVFRAGVHALHREARAQVCGACGHMGAGSALARSLHLHYCSRFPTVNRPTYPTDQLRRHHLDQPATNPTYSLLLTSYVRNSNASHPSNPSNPSHPLPPPAPPPSGSRLCSSCCTPTSRPPVWWWR